MFHYLFRLIINIFELIIVKFYIRKKILNQPIDQNNTLYVYEANFSIKFGENTKFLYQAVKRLIRNRYNLIRQDNTIIGDRDTNRNLDNNSPYDNQEVNPEIAGPHVFSHFGINRTLDRYPEFRDYFRNYIGGSIIVGGSQPDNIYHSDSE